MTNKMNENWEDLANAVILQAVHDYRHAKKLLVKTPVPAEGQTDTRYHRLQHEMSDVEGFFLSGYFKSLTHLDGQRVLAELRKEAV